MSVRIPVLRNVRLLQIHTALVNTLFILPVIVPYYRDRIGLDFHGFMTTEAVFTAVVIVMQVPSGWLADVWTRRRMLLVGTLFFGAGHALLLTAGGLAAASLAQGVMGIGFSFLSGTATALLYDTLLAEGRESEFRRAEGLRHGLGLYATGLSALTGGFLYGVHPDMPLWMTLAGSLLACAATLLMAEAPRKREAVHRHPLADMAATVRYALHGNADVGGIILLAAAVFGVTKIMLWLQQPFYTLLGLPFAWFGIMTAAGCLLGGVGGHCGHLVDGRFRNTTMLLGCAGIVFVTCMVAAFWPGYHAMPLLVTVSMMWGFGWPRVQEAINSRVPSARRATILSTASLLIGVVSIPLFTLTGRIEAAHGVQSAYAALAAVIVCGALTGFALVKAKTMRRDREAA